MTVSTTSSSPSSWKKIRRNAPSLPAPGVRKVEEPFPVKLYRLLEEVEQAGQSDIIGWSPDGDKFMVYRPKDFANTWMVLYFNQSKYKSFQRQLNLYNFRRESQGKVKGVYSHEMFLRGNLDLVVQLKRSRSPSICSDPEETKPLASPPRFPLTAMSTLNSPHSRQEPITGLARTSSLVSHIHYGSVPLRVVTVSPATPVGSFMESDKCPNYYSTNDCAPKPLPLLDQESLIDQEALPLAVNVSAERRQQCLPFSFSLPMKCSSSPMPSLNNMKQEACHMNGLVDAFQNDWTNQCNGTHLPYEMERTASGPFAAADVVAAAVAVVSPSYTVHANLASVAPTVPLPPPAASATSVLHPSHQCLSMMHPDMDNEDMDSIGTIDDPHCHHDGDDYELGNLSEFGMDATHDRRHHYEPGPYMAFAL